MKRNIVMTDPLWVPVQIQIRVPFWRRAQLFEKAESLGIPIAQLVIDAVDRAHPPSVPK